LAGLVGVDGTWRVFADQGVDRLADQIGVADVLGRFVS